MKKVLVVGVNSYIGKKFNQYVTTYHKENFYVNLVSGSNGEWENECFSNYDVVLHLSAIVHQKEKPELIDEYYNINHIMAVDIATKARRSGVKQFIYMSTAAVYGNHVTCITKDTVPNPTTYYGKSKLAAEKDIIKLQTKDFKVAIIRPPMVYGEGCKGNYAKLVKLAKYTPVFPKVNNKRSIIHITTLIQIIIEIIDSGERGYYHPQDEKYVNTSQWIVEIRQGMGRNTCLVNGFEYILKYIGKHVNRIDKMFGDFYYDKELY